MSFANRLNQLMNTFSINNSKLAKGIDVDPSLVSRWRTGNRCPASNSPHIPAIAAFFLELDCQPFQKDFMESVLLSGGGISSSHSKSRKLQALMQWLRADQKSENRSSGTKAKKRAGQTDLITPIIPQLLASNPDNYGNLPIQSIQGHLMEYELFVGREGKRQAVLHFLTTVINSSYPLDLLLCSEEDITWMTEDASFLLRWAMMLKELIDRGHKVTIIHIVNRDSSEIMSILNYWIPLHLYGTIHSFYYPKYIELPIKQTYFITKGISAIVSYDTHEAQLENFTFYFKDAFVTRVFEKNMQFYLSQCKSLVKSFTETEWLDLLEYWQTVNAQPGCMYTLSGSLNSLLMPEAICEKYNSRLGKENALRHRKLIKTMKEHMKSNLQAFRHCDILPVGLLDQMIHQRSYIHTDVKFLGHDQVKLTVPEIILYLENIIDTLRADDHYELYLTNQLPGLEALDMNISFKENIAASFYTNAAVRNNYAGVVVDEGNIIQALVYYFDDYIQQIPSSNRNKKEVIRKLERTVSVLKQS